MFDRSGSMLEDWNGSPKWQAAGRALLSALAPLADQLTIGVVLFPSAEVMLTCSVDPITAPGQLRFSPGPEALAALRAAGPGGMPDPLYSPVMGRTPTTEAVRAADAALADAELAGASATVLITDGEPNCMWDEKGTVAIIASWLQRRSTKTYVIGLPGVTGSGPTLLEELAQAGGTAHYLTPADAARLQQKLQEIAGETISLGITSCSIALDRPATPSETLQLVVEEADMPGVLETVPPDLAGAGGWALSADRMRLDLTGGLCTSALAGRLTQLSLRAGCDSLPLIPASHLL